MTIKENVRELHDLSCHQMNNVSLSCRPQGFPSGPARELSSISFWSESKASRKCLSIELWPTSLLPHGSNLVEPGVLGNPPVSLLRPAGKPSTSTRPFSPSCSSMRWEPCSLTLTSWQMTWSELKIINFSLNTQTATIDDESANQMRTLLLIVTVVSNFPLIIVGLGIILLLVLVVLFCRNRQKKVGTSGSALNRRINPHCYHDVTSVCCPLTLAHSVNVTQTDGRSD